MTVLKKKLKFEIRKYAHYFFWTFCIAMSFHAPYQAITSKTTTGLDAREDDDDDTDNIDGGGGGLVNNVDTTNDIITINGGDGNEDKNKNESLREQA